MGTVGMSGTASRGGDGPKLIAIESPFAGNVDTHVLYAFACARFVMREGHYPYASHIFFTQFLDDTDPDQRRLGMKAGLAWAKRADERWVFTDLCQPTAGMKSGITSAKKAGQAVIEIQIGEDWPELVKDLTPESAKRIIGFGQPDLTVQGRSKP